MSVNSSIKRSGFFFVLASVYPLLFIHIIIEYIVLCSQAVDIFASFSTSAANRLTVMKELAKMWAIPISLAETLYPSHEPAVQVSNFSS